MPLFCARYLFEVFHFHIAHAVIEVFYSIFSSRYTDLHGVCGVHKPSVCAQTLSLELMSYMTVVVGLSLFILFFPSFLDLSTEVEMSILHGYQAFDDLFATVAFLLQSSPSSVFITTYHNRRCISIFFSCFRFS